MDPSVSLVLQSPDTEPLKRAAQYHPAASQYDGATARATQTPTRAPLAVLQKYRFLASRIEVNVSSSTNQPNLTDSLWHWISLVPLPHKPLWSAPSLCVDCCHLA